MIDLTSIVDITAHISTLNHTL